MTPRPQREGWVRCRLKDLMGVRSIRSVAIAIGVTEATVAQYYHGKFKSINCRTAALLCRHFEVTMGEMFFLGGDDLGEDDKM